MERIFRNSLIFLAGAYILTMASVPVAFAIYDDKIDERRSEVEKIIKEYDEKTFIIPQKHYDI